VSLTFELTGTTHTCVAQYCATEGPPVFPCAAPWTGPQAQYQGTPSATLRSAICADSKPVHYGAIYAMIDMDWSAVVEGSGAISAQFTTGFGVLAGLKLLRVYYCKLDNHEGCNNLALLGKSDDRNQALVSSTQYTTPVYNSSGTPGTYAALPNGSGTQTLMFIYTFSGPAITGYDVPIYWDGEIVLSGWSLAGAVIPRRRIEGY
jgi:hypothetical protein